MVAKQNLPGIETIATELDISTKDLLKNSIPKSVTYILPIFAAGQKRGEDPGMKKKVNKANNCYKLLCKELSEEVCVPAEILIVLILSISCDNNAMLVYIKKRNNILLSKNAT